MMHGTTNIKLKEGHEVLRQYVNDMGSHTVHTTHVPEYCSNLV